MGGTGRSGLQRVFPISIVDADLLLLGDIDGGYIRKDGLSILRQGLRLLLHAKELSHEAVDLCRVLQLGADHHHRNTQLLGELIGLVLCPLIDGGDMEGNGGTGRDHGLVVDRISHAEIG